MEGDLHGIDILASCYITTLIWMSQKVVCWWAGFSTVPVVFLVVVTWLKLIHPDLPKLIKQRYGTELRSRTLASIEPEIFLVMDSLLDELHSQSASAMRASIPAETLSEHECRAVHRGKFALYAKKQADRISVTSLASANISQK